MEKEKPAQTVKIQQKFEANVTLDEFMDRVNPKGVLKEAVKGAHAIVSTSDVQLLFESSPASNLHAARVPDSELIELLRLVKEGGEREVFSGAEIRFAPVDVQSTNSIQTFVNVKRLSSTPNANRFLGRLGLDMNQSAAYAITIENGAGRYASIFLPPIVTNYKKSNFEAPLSNLKEMVRTGQGITLKGLEGDTNLDIAALLNSFNAEMAGPGNTIAVVLDGTHRAYVCYMANVPMNAIVIKGEDSPRNIPIKFEDIVVALERPQKSEDRYLGVVRSLPKLNLADLGIGQNR